MGTSSNIKNLILLSALSTSVIPVSYEIDRESITPSIEVKYTFDENKTYDYKKIEDNSSLELNSQGDMEKIGIVISFSKELVENLKDMDSEFIEIVNNNFWDLI